MILIIVYIVYILEFLAIWFIISALTLHFDKKSKEKVHNHLMDICKKDNVYIFHQKEPLKHNSGMNKKALGTYTWRIDITEEEKILYKLPRITLLDGENKSIKLLTFAHEVGHHVNVRDNNDRSEKVANKYVGQVFKEVLALWKYWLLYAIMLPDIYSFSDKKIDKNKGI